MMGENKIRSYIISSVIPITIILLVSYQVQKEYGLFTLAYQVIVANVWMQWVAILLIGLGVIVPLLSLFAWGLIKILIWITTEKIEKVNKWN